jgi:hypothetical protein
VLLLLFVAGGGVNDTVVLDFVIVIVIVLIYVSLQVFTVVTMKNAVFWDVSAFTCSRWFLARGFLYLEDGGETFL